MLSQGERRLAAIMFTDIVGYTSLTQSDERQAMEVLKRHNDILRPVFQRHRGKEVKSIGDSFLLEFASALDATSCAVELQTRLHDYNASTEPDWRFSVRVGVHLGDVIHGDGDVFGDAVNIASRIEPLAAPGGICVSEEVYAQVRNKADVSFEKLESRPLKNVNQQIGVYRVVMPWERTAPAERTEFDRRRVAVLPLISMITDPNDQYFADGMTEELITSLSKVKDLTVIARTSVMRYKGASKSVSEIGAELNAGTVLEGSVRKAGTRVRITVQLIDVQSEGHRWAENYDRQLDDVFAIQSEIAEMVARELRVQLVESERRQLEKRDTESTEAYTCFLQGREMMRERSEPGLRRALGLFERTLVLDPTFARAHSGLASCYVWLANDGYEAYEQMLPKAEIAVNKALRLDPELGEAHATLALIHFLGDDVDGCEAEARRAIELNPSLPDAYQYLSNVTLLRGQTDEGLKLSEAAYQLDPGAPAIVWRLGRFYFYLGRETDALQFWDRTEQLAPAGTHRMRTEYYLSRGDIEKAKEHYSMASKLEPSNFWVGWMGGFIAAQTGDREGALKAIRTIEERGKSAYDLNGIGFVLYALGDLDSYFVYMNKATDQHLVQYYYVMYCPLFAKGRVDPRYAALVEKIRALRPQQR
jgi:TolB-like protein/lipoprotein NlpI